MGHVVVAAEWDEEGTEQVVSVVFATADEAGVWGEQHCGGMNWDVYTEEQAAAEGIE